MTSVWPTSSVGDQFEIQLGKMLDAERNAGVRRPYIGNRAVQWGKIRIEAAGSVPLTPTDLRRYRLQSGDLLVCEGGEVGRAAIWADEIPECYFQKALHRLRPRDGYDPRLMLAFLEYCSSNGGFVNYVTQTSIAHLPRDKFAQMTLPVPQKREQRAIAEALTDCGDYIDALERLIAKKRDVKQGMMQELLTGRTRLPGFAGEWRSRTIGEVANVIMGQSPPGSSYNQAGNGLPLIQGKADIQDRRTFERVWTTSPTKVVGEGGVVLTVRAPVGFTARAHTNSCLGRGVCALSSVGSNDFLFHAMVAAEPKWGLFEQGSTFTSVNSDQVRSFVLEWPPDVEEQKQIAAIVDDVDAEIDALERRLESARAVKVGMMQELLTGRTRLPVEEDT